MRIWSSIRFPLLVAGLKCQSFDRTHCCFGKSWITFQHLEILDVAVCVDYPAQPDDTGDLRFASRCWILRHVRGLIIFCQLSMDDGVSRIGPRLIEIGLVRVVIEPKAEREIRSAERDG